MTAALSRVIEDEADEAQSNLSDVRRLRDEALGFVEMVRRNAKLQRADVAVHMIDFANGLQDLVGDDLHLAEQAAER